MSRAFESLLRPAAPVRPPDSPAPGGDRSTASDLATATGGDGRRPMVRWRWLDRPRRPRDAALLALAAILVIAAAAAANPCIVGSDANRQTARTVGLAGIYLDDLDAIPAGANVVVLGDAWGGPENPDIALLLGQGCRLIRVAGATPAEFLDRLRSFKAIVDAGRDPFADLPAAMGAIRHDPAFPVLTRTPLGQPNRGHRHPEFLPQPLFVPPDPPDLPAGFASAGRMTLAVRFDPQRATLRPQSLPALERLLRMMQDHPTLGILIEGHTDNYQSEEYNLNLSRERAEAIRSWLIDRGIDGNRMRTIGYGESRPIADNSTSAGRARNRRVEIVRDQ